MPGNEIGDRVHNFFAQDNTSQGQHNSQGNWPVLSNNYWVGDQKQTDLNSNSKNYNSQNSDIDRGPDSYPLHGTHGLSFAQPNQRPDFAKSRSLNEQMNLNGFMHGNQFHQTRQNEVKFLAVDRESDERHLIASRDLSVLELQQASGPDNRAKAPVRSQTSVAPVSLDLFGGQQQMNHQQSNVPQQLLRQHSGVNDMEQLQQQYMIRKMHELQMQQQLNHLDSRHQNMMNQVPPFAKQATGGQFPLANGTPTSELLQYPRTAEVGTNRLNRGSPTMQAHASGLVYASNLGHALQSVDGDQSLYGVPVSNSRGLTVNEYSQMMRDRSSLSQMPASSHSLQGSQRNLLQDQVHAQDGPSFPMSKFHNENMLRHAARQSVNPDMRNIGGLQLGNSVPKNALQQGFMGRQEPAVQRDALPEKSIRQNSSPRDEVALDPTEEKILFGSDDSLFGHDELSNGSAPIQIGSWSALMQSAVADTSRSDVLPQEELSGLIFGNNPGPPANQHSSVPINCGKLEGAYVDSNIGMPSVLTSGSPSPSNDINSNNVTRLNQFRHKFQNHPGDKLQNETSQQFVQSMEESGKWSNTPLQQSVAEGSQIFRNASNHNPETHGSPKVVSAPWVSGETRTRQQSNVWSSVQSGEDRVLNNRDTETFQRNQLGTMHGEVVGGSSLRKSNSIPSAMELVPGNSATGNTQDKKILSMKDTSSVSLQSTMGVADGNSQFVQSKNLLGNWKSANVSSEYQGAESVGSMLHQVKEPAQVLDSLDNYDREEVIRQETHKYDIKENFNSSHHSNSSQHSFGGFGESGMSNSSDSQSLPTGKQKSSNQLTKKPSVPRKFQYHPMGNLDEDAGPTYGLRQPTHMQSILQQNAHFGQTNFRGQAARIPTSSEKGKSTEFLRENKGSDKEQSHGDVPGYAPNMSGPFSQASDTYTLDNAASSSQNMLELLHKVDQPKDQKSMMQFSSSECKASPEIPEAEKNDGVGYPQRSQSSVSQGFGLQLGPPSQRVQISDNPLSSQNAQGKILPLHSSLAAAEIRGDSRQMVPLSSDPSLPFPKEESPIESKIRSVNPGHAGNQNSLYRMPGNFPSTLSSGTTYSISHLQNQHTAMVNGQIVMNRQIDLSGGNTYCSVQRGCTEVALPDASVSRQEDNIASTRAMLQQSIPNHTQERVTAATVPNRDHMRTSQHFSVPGSLQQRNSSHMLHNMWSNVPPQLHTLGSVHKVSPHFQESFQPNVVESSSVPLGQGYVNLQASVDGEEQRSRKSIGEQVAGISTDPELKVKESLEKSSSNRNCLDDSPVNSASTQNDIEVFGRSLKPNSLSRQNYSLINQMQAAEIDPSNGGSKQMKGADNLFNVDQVSLGAGQQNEQNVVGNSLDTGTGVASDGSGILSFSKPADILRGNTPQHGNGPTQDVIALASSVSNSNSSSDYLACARVDHPRISPQMAPSWFNQYGTLKNGQMWSMDDQQRLPSLGPGGPPLTHGKSSNGFGTVSSDDKGIASPIDNCQIGNIHGNSTPSLVVNGQFSNQSSQLNLTGQHGVILRPKKRKSATSELHPWHSNISEGSRMWWSLRMAEADWCKAANRIHEKVEDDVELIEDKPAVLKSKRRLTLTTQLMQQLLRPAPANILSANAMSNYESVAYAVSRIALGDACNSVSCSADRNVSRDEIDKRPAESKLSDRNGVHFAKVVEELMGRTRKLADDFSRLDKSVSISDLKVECQDQDKFSVINRFARFHGRWQSDSAETTSTDIMPNNQKPVLQRYVTALPMPRSLPDRVQCLSL